MGKRQDREDKIANKLIREEERKIGRKLTNEEIVEKFQKAEQILEEKEKKERREKRRQEKIKRIKGRIVGILAALGITIGGGVALLNSGEEPKPEPVGQETENNDEKDNQTSKTDREKFLEELQKDVDKNVNKTEENQNEKLNNTIDAILEEYNGNLPEEEKIEKEALGIILRENIGEAHIRQINFENGEKIYIDNPLVAGNLLEGEEWVEAKDVNDEYILVDTENNSTVAGIGTINNEITEIDIQYVIFGGKEYVQNEETYVGLPEGIDLEGAYANFSDYYQLRAQQQEEQERNNDGFEH